MKLSKTKKLPVLVLSLLLILASGCSFSKRPERYKAYVESLITANYLGVSDEYLEATGANEADAEALYLANASRLSQNLITYYGLEISNDSSLGPLLVELSKNIYSKTKYEVGTAYEKDDTYYVDVTIYPINILYQSEADINAYVEDFNDRVQGGEFNNYERAEYENEFASGIIDILQENVNEITYADPVTITVQIILNNDSYYISDEDLLLIDSAIIATSDTPAATPSDAAPAE